VTLLGLLLLWLAASDPRHRQLRAYNSAVAAWSQPGGGQAQLQAALSSAPPVLQLSAAGGNGSAAAAVLLLATRAPPPPLGNASGRAASYAATALAYTASLPSLCAFASPSFPAALTTSTRLRLALSRRRRDRRRGAQPALLRRLLRLPAAGGLQQHARLAVRRGL